MPKVNLPITDGFYESASLPFSAQRCINWYPSFAENGSLSDALLYGTPGISELLNTGETEKNRGAHVMNDKPYFVNGTTLYRLDRTILGDGSESFSTTTIGTVAGSKRVSMADNGTQLCIVVPGLIGYIYDRESDVFQEITDPDFTINGKSQQVAYLDGFFVHISGSNIFHSELNDGLSYNALDVAQAEADPDRIVAIFVLKNQLFVLGSETIEVFSNVGKFPFTFQRIPGFFQSIGCFSKFSAVRFDNNLAFVGGSTNERIGVYFGAGNSFARISTTPIEQKLQSLMSGEIENIFCWTYSANGGVFLGVSTENSEFCFVYDRKASQLAQRQIWHERRSLFTPNLSQRRWRANSVIKAYGRILIGDRDSGRIGELSQSIYTEFDNFIYRKCRSRPLANQGERLFIDEIEITVNSGSTTDNDADPQIRLSWSDDNIRYSNERFGAIGEQGNYQQRLYFRRLGNAPRFRTFDFTMSDDSDPTIVKAEVRLDSTNE